MATSGQVQGNGISIGYGACFWFTNWQLAGQDVNGNYSVINWQTYFHFQGSDMQLDNGRTDTTVGNVWYNGGRVYNYAGNFSTRDMGLASGQFAIGHDGAGNQTLSISGGIDLYQSGRSQGGASWGLPTIPRYANIDGFNIDWVNDAALQFSWHADRSCDYASWWSGVYDGGGHHDFATGGQGWWTIQLTNLRSNTTYDVTVAIRNAASGLWTTSGTAYPTTGNQSNFFDGGDS